METLNLDPYFAYRWNEMILRESEEHFESSQNKP